MNQPRRERRVCKVSGIFAVLVTACTTTVEARRPVTELWYAHVVPPNWLDETCRTKSPRRAEGLAAYSRRVPAFDLDCIGDQVADPVPDPTGSTRYLIANTLLYIQRYRTGQAAFDPVEIIERMDLRRAANDPYMLYVAAELFFHGAAFRPVEANLYAPCAERLARRAIHLGYDAAVWTLNRYEAELGKYPNGTPCDIDALREMLD